MNANVVVSVKDLIDFLNSLSDRVKNKKVSYVDVFLMTRSELEEFRSEIESRTHDDFVLTNFDKRSKIP